MPALRIRRATPPAPYAPLWRVQGQLFSIFMSMTWIERKVSQMQRCFTYWLGRSAQLQREELKRVFRGLETSSESQFCRILSIVYNIWNHNLDFAHFYTCKINIKTTFRRRYRLPSSGKTVGKRLSSWAP